MTETTNSDSQPPARSARAAIDDLLADLADRKDHHVPQSPQFIMRQVAEAILPTIDPLTDDWRQEPALALFQADLKISSRRFIAVCLLRLLAIAPDALATPEIKAKTFSLFDDALAADIYQHCRLQPKQQTFEKERVLSEVVPAIESSLLDSLTSLHTIEAFPALRHEFMQSLNQSLAKAILAPFLPRELLGARLSELFQSVEDYLSNSNSPTALQQYTQAQSALKWYAYDAILFGTKYSRAYLARLADTLSSLLSSKLQDSPAGKPAKLGVEEYDKKYPIATVGSHFPFPFIVENNGPGTAFDLSLTLSATTGLHLERPEIYLGNLAPGSIRVEVPITVAVPASFPMISITLFWNTITGDPESVDSVVELVPQRSDIDWAQLTNEDPYQLEPISTEEDLVDRTEILDQLLSQARAARIGSAYIFGQKRVGKTSIAQTLKSRLAELCPKDYLVIYREGGEYVHPDPLQTLETLGTTLTEEIIDSDPRLAHVQPPQFDGALSPLDGFLRTVQRVAPGLRTLFILDEFDELPLELYKRGPVGDSFFLTLRSISGKPTAGFILVGSEKLQYILSCQGDALNKFHAICIDYFDKETNWSDFQELVRRPVAKWFDVTDEALTALYDQAAGNPYFTKLICRSLFKLMVERRDSYITEKEVNDSVSNTLASIASNSFQRALGNRLQDGSMKHPTKGV